MYSMDRSSFDQYRLKWEDEFNSNMAVRIEQGYPWLRDHKFKVQLLFSSAHMTMVLPSKPKKYEKYMKGQRKWRYPGQMNSDEFQYHMRALAKEIQDTVNARMDNLGYHVHGMYLQVVVSVYTDKKIPTGPRTPYSSQEDESSSSSENNNEELMNSKTDEKEKDKEKDKDKDKEKDKDGSEDNDMLIIN